MDPLSDGALQRPSYRRTLRILKDTWENCTRCGLGEYRNTTSKEKVVHGMGYRNGIMFVGASVGWEATKHSTPFAGDSLELLSEVFKQKGIEGIVYLTNGVVCHSCDVMVDEDGEPKVSHYGRIVTRDRFPNKEEIKACLPRLHEEIYLVDPVVIVGMGKLACEILTGDSVNIERDRGKAVEIEIPGRTDVAVLTEKKREWIRKVRGVLSAPSKQFSVKYLLVQTLGISDVLAKIKDKGKNSLVELFSKDIDKAVRTYDKIQQQSPHLTAVKKERPHG